MNPFIRLLFITVLQFWLLITLATVTFITRSGGLLHFPFPFEAYASSVICLNLFLMLVCWLAPTHFFKGKTGKWRSVRK